MWSEFDGSPVRGEEPKRFLSGENHPDVAISYSEISQVYDQLGDYNEAIDFCKKSLEIVCKKHDKVDILERLGLFICVAKKLSDFKVESFEHIYNRCVEELGTEHELVKTLLSYITVLESI